MVGTKNESFILIFQKLKNLYIYGTKTCFEEFLKITLYSSLLLIFSFLLSFYQPVTNQSRIKFLSGFVFIIETIFKRLNKHLHF